MTKKKAARGTRTGRRIVTHIATSADGFIARPDGNVDWLHEHARGEYGTKAFYRTMDTILWGRKTYDWLIAYYRKQGKTPKLFDTKVKNYVFSRRPPKRVLPGAVFVTGRVRPFAQRLRAEPGKHIWMMGGAGLIASFLDAGEIDELDVHVIPVLIGKGIPLVAPRHREIPLRLLACRKFPDGVVRLRYEVVRH